MLKPALHLLIWAGCRASATAHGLPARHALGLTGWVRNRADGTVEAVISGKPELLERIVIAAQRGPRFAAVSQIARHGIEGEDWPDFAIRPTA